MQHKARIAIIGAGATGLGAGYLCKRAQEAGHDFDFAIYEKDTRVGGKIAGEIVEIEDGGETRRFVIDGGPDCFSAFKPAAMRHARMAGIGDQKLNSQEELRGTYIWRKDRKHPLPEGFSMFVPTKLAPVFETELLSEEGKREMLRELTVEKKIVPEGERNDESLEDFITRRFGKEVLDYLAEPFIGGVHASAPETMSLAASFPMYLEMEQKYGSVIRGVVTGAEARKRAAERRAKEAAEAAARGEQVRPAPKMTIFATFKEGMHQLTDAIAQKIGFENINLGRGIDTVTFNEALEADEGEIVRDYKISFEDGAVEFFDAVFIGTESFAGSLITRELNSRMSKAYEGIPNLSSSTCSFAFKLKDVDMPKRGFGTLVPAVEERALLAATWSSVKWGNRAPEGYVLIRGFCGTPHNQEIMEKSDEELTQIIFEELREIMDIHDDAKPLFSRFYRWTLGMSQYAMGHLDRVEAIEEECEKTKGLAAGGGCFRGVGVPNCLESGEAGIAKIFKDLGIDYREENPSPAPRG